MLLTAVCVASLMLMVVEQGASQTTPPSRCCFEKEFTASLGEVGARITSTGTSTFTGSVEFAYDFYKKRVRTRSQVYVNGIPTTMTRINDFVNRIEYDKPIIGTCTARHMRDDQQMLPPCIPADAVFLGHAMFGYGSETLQANSWQFTLANTTTTVKVAVTEECVPVFEAFMSRRNGSATEVTLFYTGYHPGIDDMTTLDPPADCVMINEDHSNNNGGSGGDGQRPIGRRSISDY